MKRRKLFTAALAGAMLVAGAPLGAQASNTWDGLVRVKSKAMDQVYLQSGADFRGYTKVLIDPTEVAFEKNWRRDYNRSASAGARISDQELQNTISKAVTAAADIFASAWAKGGYTVVNSPGPDVLRVKTGIINVRVDAPDKLTSARSRSYSREAGSATLFLEARDSTTGALLGRAIDQRVVGDNMTAWRTSASNRADFRNVVINWANASVRGMSELKARSPINP